MNEELLLTTQIMRSSVHDGSDVPCDVVIYFAITGFHPGAAATWTDPEVADEYDFEFLRAEFDGDEPSGAPGPLAFGEVATLNAWFVDNYSKAWTAAQHQLCEMEAL